MTVHARANPSLPYKEDIANNLVATPGPEEMEEGDGIRHKSGTLEDWAHDY
jgi:hypothetical protein